MADAPVAAPAPAPAPIVGPEQGTSTVYDAVNKRLVDATPEQIATNPARFEDVGKQGVHMVGPDGQKYTVEANQVDQLGDGWSYGDKADVQHQNLVDAFAKKHAGGFDTGVHSMANQLLFGLPETSEDEQLSGKTSSIFGGHESNAEIEGRRQAEGENKAAKYIGGGVGLGLNLAVTGGLSALGGGEARAGIAGAEALGAADGANAVRGLAQATNPGLLSRLGSVAARGAAEGAAYSVPQSAVQLSYGDTEHAAESIVYGAGLGGLLGLGAGAFSEGLSAGKTALKNKAVSSGLIDEAGVVNPAAKAKFGIATPEELGKLRNEAIEKIDQHASLLDEQISRAKSASDRATAKEAAQLGVTPTDLATKIQTDILEQKPGLTLKGFGGEMAEQQKKALGDVVQKIASKGDEPISFADLRKLRSSVTQGIDQGGEQGRLLRQIDTIIGNEQTKAMTTAYAKLPTSPNYANYLTDLQKAQQTLGVVNGMPPTARDTLAKWGVNALSTGITGAAGAALGPAGVFVGFKQMKGIADKVLQNALMGGATQVSERTLKNIAEHPEAIQWFGSMLAKDMSAASMQRALDVPRMLATKAAVQNPPDVVKNLLGPKANGLSKDQQYKAVTDSITQAKADEGRVAKEVDAMGQLFGQDPALKSLVAQKQTAVIDFLYSKVPKDPHGPTPFAAVKDYKPTAAEKASFLASLEAAHSPWNVLDQHARNGSLRPEHVEAISALYPSIKDAMVQTIARMSADPQGSNLSPGVKQALSKIVGTDLTGSASAMDHQAVYSTGGPPQQGPPPPQGKHKGGGGNPRVNIKGPQLATEAQRLSKGSGPKLM